MGQRKCGIHAKQLNVEGPADLVVEIISPESRASDRGDKFYEYEQGGVPEYWLLDPERQQAKFYIRQLQARPRREKKISQRACHRASLRPTLPP